MAQSSDVYKPNPDLQLELLFKNAFIRTKDRFLSYFLATIISYGMMLAAFIVIAIVGALHFVIYAVTGSLSVTVTSAIILGLIATVGLMYIGSWGQLASLQAVIGDKKPAGIMDVFKTVKPKVWAYLGLGVYTGLFFIGLLPFSILTLFILNLLWGVWSAFMVFIFLEKDTKGLQPLWISRAMVNTRFWGILGRLLLVTLAVSVVMGALFAMNSDNPGVFSLINFVAVYIITPFAISYTYEIYKNVKQPSQAPRSIVWIVVAVIGWIIIFGSIAMGSANLIESSEDVMNQMEKDLILKKPGTI